MPQGEMDEAFWRDNDEVLRLVREDRTAEAISYCDRIAARISQDAVWRVLNLKAYVFRQAGDKAEAFRWIDQAIAANGKIASLRYRRAIWLAEAGSFDDAISDCLAGEEIERSNNSVYFLNSFIVIRAFCLFKDGKKPAAATAVKDVPQDYSVRLGGRDVRRSDFLT